MTIGFVLNKNPASFAFRAFRPRCGGGDSGHGRRFETGGGGTSSRARGSSAGRVDVSGGRVRVMGRFELAKSPFASPEAAMSSAPVRSKISLARLDQC